MINIVPTKSNALTVSHAELIDAFLSGKSATTVKAYNRDLLSFADFLQVAGMNEAARDFLSRNAAGGNLCAIHYRQSMVDAGLAPATINRRLASLRSLVKLARTLGIVTWQLEIKNVKSKAFRDTAGCGMAGVRSLIGAAASQHGKIKALRDTAIIRCLHDLGLRRGEVAALNVADVEPGRIAVMGKGKTEKEFLTLPAQTEAALVSWLAVHPGGEALFTNFHHDATQRGRLSGTSIYRLIKGLGQKAGIVTRPHGLRHTAITSVLDLTGGDLRQAQTFARHASATTTTRYDDNRQDSAGKAAALLAIAV